MTKQNFRRVYDRLLSVTLKNNLNDYRLNESALSLRRYTLKVCKVLRFSIYVERE